MLEAHAPNNSRLMMIMMFPPKDLEFPLLPRATHGLPEVGCRGKT